MGLTSLAALIMASYGQSCHLRRQVPHVGKATTTFEEMAVMLASDYEVNGRKSGEAMHRVSRLRAYFGQRHAADITSDDIMSYVRSRQGASAATIRYELAILKRMFRLAQRSGKVAQRPEFQTIEVRNARKGFFEAEGFEGVARDLPDDLEPFARFAYLTGWRKGEIQGLTWKQVDLEAGIVRLEPGTTKNGEGRTFPFASFPQAPRSSQTPKGSNLSA